jgi:glutathione synthase/RimK-type ligase-like ATP-grasp enzyme
MWHFHQADPRDILFAKQLLYALEGSGWRVFPNFRTVWHFDDKIAQKYLLEAIGAPLVPTHVFYDEARAREWVQGASFPLVFKLRRGAGSQNVRLVRSRGEAVALIRRAFSNGFGVYQGWANLRDRVRKSRSDKMAVLDIAKGVVRLAVPPLYARVAGRERGYVYFQEFVPGNDHDIRVVSIGGRAFAIKRLVREGDFRASGSGRIVHQREHIDERLVALALETAEKMGSQCAAFDFVRKQGDPVILEVSYGFSPEGYDSCPGYWDRSMVWHEGPFNPYGWMVDLVAGMPRS